MVGMGSPWKGNPGVKDTVSAAVNGMDCCAADTASGMASAGRAKPDTVKGVSLPCGTKKHSLSCYWLVNAS